MMNKLIVCALVCMVSFTSCKKEVNKGEEKLNKIQTALENEAKAAFGDISINASADVISSVVKWKGFKPTGSHDGSLKLKEGKIEIVNSIIQSGEFVIDMKSMMVLDIPASEEGNANLLGHLTSEDFFDVTKYPTAKFVITEAIPSDKTYTLMGDLTIKDKTVQKGYMIRASLSEKDGVVSLKSLPFKIDRTDFGIQYKSKKFFDNLKDKFIDDMMEISFEVNFKK